MATRLRPPPQAADPARDGCRETVSAYPDRVCNAGRKSLCRRGAARYDSRMDTTLDMPEANTPPFVGDSDYEPNGYWILPGFGWDEIKPVGDPGKWLNYYRWAWEDPKTKERGPASQNAQDLKGFAIYLNKTGITNTPDMSPGVSGHFSVVRDHFADFVTAFDNMPPTRKAKDG
jgi:hypothetical protein